MIVTTYTTKRIVMTHDEVEEALRQWLDKRRTYPDRQTQHKRDPLTGHTVWEMEVETSDDSALR